MVKESYQRSISVAATPADAYQALTTGYEHWWTSTQGKSFNQVGDRIRFTFPPNASYWTFEAKKLTPGKLVELECVEAYHIIVDKPEASKIEWLGTRTTWAIEPTGNKTDIHFTHEGLIPALHCYDVCKAGWDMFFVDSLQSYLNTGAGSPHQENT
ncbi:SRPBCC family protein [Exilibacterium tricleocarpae]|nr:SRPBCC domain-containing protein [Exilibacterium tricleocarpae]